jgi:hypothetical protein
MKSKQTYAFFTTEEKLQLLNGTCPHPILLAKPVLRSWLLYRVGTAKNDSALTDGNKRELTHRYILMFAYFR